MTRTLMPDTRPAPAACAPQWAHLRTSTVVKGVFLTAIAGVFVFGVGSAFAPRYEALVVLRACVGYFVGGAIPIASTYFAEFTPTAHRGAVVILANLFFAMGEMVTALVAWCVALRLPASGPRPTSRCLTRPARCPGPTLRRAFMPKLEGSEWRLLLVVCAFPALIAFLWGVIWLPESPHYLLVSGRREEMEELVSRLAVTNGYPRPAREDMLCAAALARAGCGPR